MQRHATFLTFTNQFSLPTKPFPDGVTYCKGEYFGIADYNRLYTDNPMGENPCPSGANDFVFNFLRYQVVQCPEPLTSLNAAIGSAASFSAVFLLIFMKLPYFTQTKKVSLVPIASNVKETDSMSA